VEHAVTVEEEGLEGRENRYYVKLITPGLDISAYDIHKIDVIECATAQSTTTVRTCNVDKFFVRVKRDGAAGSEQSDQKNRVKCRPFRKYKNEECGQGLTEVTVPLRIGHQRSE
jgi:hypothetical protein